MAIIGLRRRRAKIDYPDSDGRPMGETPDHGDNLAYLVAMLRVWFAQALDVFVAGNMFVYYAEGERNKHLSPDVFVVRGVRPVTPRRRRYLMWEEGKGPDMVIELTSASTREEDMDDKFGLYQDELKVPEFFLFDPHDEYLQPPLRGYRLHGGRYRRIRPVSGRLPSKVLGLHLERDGWLLRLYDPKTMKWLLTPPEEHEALERIETAHRREEAARRREEAARRREEAARRREEAARRKAEAEVERLRREIEELRRRNGNKS